MSTPPAAHVQPTIMEGNSEICSPLDLTLAKCRLPMYVDGAQDSKSDSNVSESSPILISSGDSVGRNTIVIEDSPPASNDNQIVNFDSVARNTIVIQDSPPASNELHTTNESSQISTVTDFSTLTVSTHGTFDSANDISSPDHTYAIGVQRSNSQQGGSYNGTCNIDLEALLQGEDDTPISGSDINVQAEPARLTLDDLKPDVNFDQFKRKLLATSSPKPAPRKTKRKILQDKEESFTAIDTSAKRR